MSCEEILLRAGLIALRRSNVVGARAERPDFPFVLRPSACGDKSAGSDRDSAGTGRRGTRSARGRCRPASLRRRQGDGKLHAEFRRHRLDARLGSPRLDDDHPGAGAILWRHGTQDERRRHRHAELRHHLPVTVLWVFFAYSLALPATASRLRRAG